MSPTTVAWIYLVIAGCLEVAMALSLGASKGFSRWPFALSFLFFAVASFGMLSLALRSLPVGTAYAVWTGIGAAGTAILGILFFNEPATLGRMFFLGMLVVAIVGLKFVSPH